MAPLSSTTIETLYPVYNIACADLIAGYTEKKAQRGSPENSLEVGKELTACMTKSAVKVRDTPCAEILLAYRDCLSSNGRLKCKQLKTQLEECSAKHVGKLD